MQGCFFHSSHSAPFTIWKKISCLSTSSHKIRVTELCVTFWCLQYSLLCIKNSPLTLNQFNYSMHYPMCVQTKDSQFAHIHQNECLCMKSMLSAYKVLLTPKILVALDKSLKVQWAMSSWPKRSVLGQTKHTKLYLSEHGYVARNGSETSFLWTTKIATSLDGPLNGCTICCLTIVTQTFLFAAIQVRLPHIQILSVFKTA